MKSLLHFLHGSLFLIVFFASSILPAQNTCDEAIVPAWGYGECTPESYDITDATWTHVGCPVGTTSLDHWFIKTATAEAWHHQASHSATDVMISVYDACNGNQIGDCLTDEGITTGLIIGNEYIIKLAFDRIATGEYTYCLWEPVDCNLEVQLSAQPNSICLGESSQLSALVSGGIDPELSWNEGLGSGEEKTVSPLESTWYSITVTDVNGCSAADSILLTVNETFTAFAGNPQQICGLHEVQLEATANSDGFWSGGMGTFSNSQSPISTYLPHAEEEGQSVILTWTTGAAGLPCPPVSDEVVITFNPEIIVDLIKIDESCFGCNNGSAIAEISGGSAPFFFLWSTDENSDQVLNLSPGSYSLTVTDFNDCTKEVSFEIETYICDEITLDADISHISCFGQIDGAIDLNISGSSLIETILWSTGDSGENIDELEPGTYSVTVVDFFNCSATDSFEVLEPSDFSVQLSSDSTFQAFGGVEPYDEPLIYFEAPWLIISITDFNGCVASDSLLISTTRDEFLKSITIYPNPFTDRLIIDSGYPDSEATYRLISADGRIVKELFTGSNEIQNQINPGFYILEVRHQDFINHIPFIKSE